MAILNYIEYVNLLKEGLIKTYNINRYKSNLEIELNSLNLNYNINIISKFIFELELFNVDKLSNDTIKWIIELCQNKMGYFTSYIWIENNFGLNSFKFDEKYLSNKYKYLKIRFEAKYEDGLYKNNLDVPEFAYHLSIQSKKDKILNNGLYPKSYNRKTKHPDRIYLFYSLDNLDEILKSLKQNDIMNNKQHDYVLFKVKLNSDIIIHTDPNYDKGFFIYDNIPPEDIEVVKENI
jgi:hypothetical protein